MQILPALRPERIPAAQAPVERCCYCWYILHPTTPYPEDWSSTICDEHSSWILIQYAHIRSQRRAAARASSPQELAGPGAAIPISSACARSI